MPYFKKLLPISISASILGWALWFLPPPQSFTTASLTQVLLFFIPLFILLVFLFNLILDFYLRSFVISLGIIILLTLKALDLFNIATIGITILAIILIIKSLKKPKKPLYQSRIPKLSKLSKQK